MNSSKVINFLASSVRPKCNHIGIETAVSQRILRTQNAWESSRPARRPAVCRPPFGRCSPVRRAWCRTCPGRCAGRCSDSGGSTGCCSSFWVDESTTSRCPAERARGPIRSSASRAHHSSVAFGANDRGTRPAALAGSHTFGRAALGRCGRSRISVVRSPQERIRWNTRWKEWSGTLSTSGDPLGREIRMKISSKFFKGCEEEVSWIRQ